MNAEGWSYHGFDLKTAAKLTKKGFDGWDAQSFHTMGITPEKAIVWVDNGFEMNKIEDWNDEEFEPEEAKNWADNGFKPKEAKEWDNLLMDIIVSEDTEELEEAKKWIANGLLSPEDIKKWQDMKLTLNDAKEYFKKTRIDIDVDEVKQFIDLKFSIEEAAKFNKKICLQGKHSIGGVKDLQILSF